MVDVEQVLNRINLPRTEELNSDLARELFINDLAEILRRKEWSHYLYCSRMAPILEFIEKNVDPSARILDLGCAQGNFSLVLAEMGYSVTGVDREPNFISYAKLKQTLGSILQKNLAQFNVESAGSIKAGDGFDVVLFLEIIEHLADPEETLEAVLSSLKKGGLLILSTVNKARITSKAPSYTQYLRGNKERAQFNNSARGSEHVYEFTRNELVGFLVEDIGLEMVAIYPTASLAVYPLCKLLSLQQLKQLDRFLQGPFTTFGYVVVCRK